MIVGLAVAGLAAALFVRERPGLECRVRERIQAEAFRHGVTARIDGVSVGVWPPVRLTGVRLEKPGAWSLDTDRAALSLRAQGRGLLGRARLALGPTTITGPSGLTLHLVPTVWDVEADAGEPSALSLRQPASGLTLSRRRVERGAAFDIRAEEAPLGSLLELRRQGMSLLDAGTIDGRLSVETGDDATRFDIDIRARGMRLAAVEAASGEGPAPLGPPADVELSLAGGWHGPEHRLEVTRWRMRTDGLAVTGSLSLEDVPADPRLELAFDIERVDFARLLALSALDAPAVVPASLETRAEGSLGSASLSARIAGRLSDPASFTVKQDLDFRPPLRTPAEIERLKGSFEHVVALPGGERRTIDVSPASPDFIRVGDVPPLLVHTLLIGEDAGFFGHRGLDLSELPAAVLTNWSRGEPARGASTITQQLAKNLFLSREKKLGRKVQELALALLLESALGKERILEIYLNVIEWGPGVYGLRPASRHYFGMEPAELSPAQMALLVALVPGPMKYQRSLAAGTPSPGFRPLVDRLLAKLRSVDALTDEEYYDALADDLRVQPPGAGE
jgi:Transglycosylase